ncbi:hypothetical protein CPC16_005486 [Podila verticillata]|nr:hypothetical protein CPC16_005486 [Podila verticillata]
MIVMFHGSVDDIPEGWALCDGSQEGVPDLTGRFILAASGDHNDERSDATVDFSDGASFELITDKSDSLDLEVNGRVGETALTINQIPAHKHMTGPVYDSLDRVNGQVFSAGFGYERRPDGTQGVSVKSISTEYAMEAVIPGTSITGGTDVHDHEADGAPPHVASAYQATGNVFAHKAGTV